MSQGYGYNVRPPMPDRFIPGQVTQPRSQLPRNVAEVVKTGIPAQFAAYVQSIGVYTDHSVYTVAADTSEHTMKSLTFSPGTLSTTSSGFKFRAGGTVAGSGGVKTVRLYFGGIQIGPDLSVATGSRSWLLEGEIWNNGYTYQQRWRLTQIDGSTTEGMNVSDDTSLSVETA